MKLEIQEVEGDAPTLCLNMIVKNESRVIRRLLESVHKLLDCYCICDTGSTDDTIQIIEDFFKEKEIPGKVVQEPFRDFGYNRSFALQACNGMSDYAILLDADMILDIVDFDKYKLRDADSFCLLQGNDSYYYQNMRIVRNNGLFKYVGVTHEHVAVPPGNHNVNIKKNELFIRDVGDGGSKSDKFERDIRLLLEGIKQEPNNVRYHFYLANSYKDSQHFDEAIEYYKKRIAMGDWEQEVWYSNYNIANIYEHLGDMGNAILYWLECYNLNPLRLENLHKIVRYYRVIGKCKTAKIFYDIAKAALQSGKINKDSYLFLYNDAYTHLFDYEYTIIATYVGSDNINDAAVSVFNNSSDGSIVNNVLSNMKYYKFVLQPKTTIDFSFTMECPVGDKQIKFNSSSTSLLKKIDGTGYMLNFRMVNYRIERNNGYYLDCEQHIMTNNKYMELDNEFNVTFEKVFDVEYEDKRYLGVEDVRIFTRDDDESKLVYIGTSQHKNGKIGMITGDYDPYNESVLKTQEVSPAWDSWCEKNWAYFKYQGETRLVYKWHPLEVGKIDKETNVMSIVNTITNTPKIFSHTRGSTCGFAYNDEIWYMLHLVSYETPRQYYHIFAVFDKEMNFLRHSAPFKFQGESIEYCLGLVVEDDRVICTFSEWDGSSKLVVYDKSYVDSLVKYT
jgi:tetratricopeptide (TPR) repeat protein